MADAVRPGDLILLVGPDGERHVLEAPQGPARIAGLGVLTPDQLSGRTWGDAVRLGLKEFVVTRPVLADHVRSLRRGAQIILPKDASRILFETGLGAGQRVLEGGVGSGALTLALAHAVAPTGRVIALDLRADHLEAGRRNVAAARLDALVDFREGDVRAGVPETDVDAAVVDIPDPEAAVAALKRALRSGGVVAAYTPLVTQAEQAVRALREQGFFDVRTLELLERSWIVHERGSRPAFEMLGHTGFLTFARRP